MAKKLLTAMLSIIFALSVAVSASAEVVTIQPVTNPWDDPAYLEVDGGIYYANNDEGRVVIWETPECNRDAQYIMVDNGTALLIDYRIRYMNNIPWGSTNFDTKDEDGNTVRFQGWVQMSDLTDAEGNPVVMVIPDHPEIPNPVSTSNLSADEQKAPEPPKEAITVSKSYNEAVIYTAVGIAVVAIALDVYLIIKHKALNKKGE